MKYLIVDFSDGSRWRIPATVVARNRAEYYKDDGYDEEFKYTMEDKYELEDWAFNNMNWSDVSTCAHRIPREVPKVDYESEWSSCKHWVEEQ